jgi:hypothetical protein
MTLAFIKTNASGTSKCHLGKHFHLPASSQLEMLDS